MLLSMMCSLIGNEETCGHGPSESRGQIIGLNAGLSMAALG